MTALMHATRKGHLGICMHLIEKGANLEAEVSIY